MGEPVRIVDLARKMILLSGLKPDEDIRIEFSGIRPGEKLYEELSALEENTVPTPHAQIRVFSSREVSIERTGRSLDDLRQHAEARNPAAVVLALKEMVPDYNPSNFVLRQALQEKTKRTLAVANVS